MNKENKYKEFACKLYKGFEFEAKIQYWDYNREACTVSSYRILAKVIATIREYPKFDSEAEAYEHRKCLKKPWNDISYDNAYLEIPTDINLERQVMYHINEMEHGEVL